MARPQEPKIGPKLLGEDFRIARSALEHGHSGIYRYTPKAELDQAFDAAAARLDRPMSPLEFYRVLAPAVARIKCGHTGVRPPRDVEHALDTTIPLFPFDVEILDGRVYVVREYLAEPQGFLGLEIRRVNDFGIDQILSTMLAATPGDADSQTARPWKIAHFGPSSFPRLLFTLSAVEAPFRIDLADPHTGLKKTVLLGGVKTPDRIKIGAARYPETKRPQNVAELSFLESGRIAVLTVREFSGSVEGKPLGEYFEEAFHEVQERKSGSLIIDLRGNGGGSDSLGRQLLSYLLDAPFQYYDDLVFNAREFDFFRYSDGAEPIPADAVEKRPDGKFHDIKHPNLGIQQPSEPRFSGKVVVLMNGGSFSTTCEFLSNLHYRKRATFVGEEAGGGYYGNTSGRMVVVTLPNSGVTVRVPLRTYYLAVKGADPKRSILPDYEVRPSIDDLLSGTDKAMARAVALAR